MHNNAFSKKGMNAFYIPVDVSPEELLPKLDAFRALGGRGVNLTRPLKETIQPYLQSQTSISMEAGAANTIVWTGDGWTGDNTDAQALIRLLKHASGKADALVVGGGGVSRASVTALKYLGYTPWLAVRDPARVRWHSQVISWSDIGVEHPWSVVVNATPLGQVKEAQWTDVPYATHNTVVVDWVYQPRFGKLLQSAQAHGAQVIDGLSLLIEQASLSWYLWFGMEGPREEMKEAVWDI